MKNRLLRIILKYLCKITYPAISQKDLKYSNDLHPVFIIGVPRSGSTILYQLITNCLDVLYPDNVVNMCRENPYLGFWLSQLMFDDKPHNCFTSNYGRSGALHGPSELGNFWKKWLPVDQHFVDFGEIDETSKNEIQTIFYHLITKYKKPLIYKNLAMGQRLRLIKEFAPNAKLIYIKRDPLYNIQSIFIKSRQNCEQWWSIKPGNWQDLSRMDCLKRSVYQYYYLEKQIQHDLQFFASEQLMTVMYDDIVKTAEILEKTRRFIGPNIKYRSQDPIVSIKLKDNIKIAPDKFRQIEEELKSLKKADNAR